MGMENSEHLYITMNRNCHNPLLTPQTPPRPTLTPTILSPTPNSPPFPPYFALPTRATLPTRITLPTRVSHPLPLALRMASPNPPPARWQQKRNTLPAVASQPMLAKVVSPQRKERQARISFSYNDQQARMELRAELQGEQVADGRTEGQEEKEVCRWKKQMRIQLHSLVYAHVVLPYPSPDSQQPIRSPFSSVDKRADSSRISRMASTEASYVFNPDRPTFQPGTLQFSSRKRLSQQSRPPALLQQIPAKVLNKTIFINNDSYFGAVLGRGFGEYSTNNSLPSQKEVSRGWKSYVKCLLSEGDDLKQSIHVGPETRHVNLRCEFLGGLGREIKESVVGE